MSKAISMMLGYHICAKSQYATQEWTTQKAEFSMNRKQERDRDHEKETSREEADG
jgi:hypothetical protein